MGESRNRRPLGEEAAEGMAPPSRKWDGQPPLGGDPAGRKKRSGVVVAFAAMSLIFFVSLAPSPALADVGNCVESGCGDGIVSPQFSETCDDGNALGGDGCSSECTVECGYNCESSWGSPCHLVPVDDIQYHTFANSTCLPLLGDSILSPSENARSFNGQVRQPCDDGNTEPGDGCECFVSVRGEQQPRAFKRGCFVEDRWHCATDRPSYERQCDTRQEVPDICECITWPLTVTLPGVPLDGLPEETMTTSGGYTGASTVVGCGACSCGMYGGCEEEGEFCLSHRTCNGNGFCDKDARCVCWGNFTGDACDRCKQNHYGRDCKKYCSDRETCGGYGTCDINGNCVWGPFCDGVRLSGDEFSIELANECGDGRRLGDEECDDGNLDDGDGCSSQCGVEPGFLCDGGCELSGDVHRRYGECRADVCAPVPCRWDRMVTNASTPQGALHIQEPTFLEAYMTQSSPTPSQENTLSITLKLNVPLKLCSLVTKNISHLKSPWYSETVEWPDFCDPVSLTISGLAGAEKSSGVISLLEQTPEGQPESFFGEQAVWDNVEKTLTISVLRGLPALKRHVIAFRLNNPARGQNMPEIFLEGSGIVIKRSRVSTPPPDSELAPLKVYPFEGDARRRRLFVKGGKNKGLAEEFGSDQGRVEARERGGGDVRGGGGGGRIGRAERKLLQAVVCSAEDPEALCTAKIGQSTSLPGSLNMLTVTLRANRAMTQGTLMTLTGLIPVSPPRMFAVTSKTQCAQSLPYGPDSTLLTNSTKRHQAFGAGVDAFFSTQDRNMFHTSWLQHFYVCTSDSCLPGEGQESQFDIFWSFSDAKSLQQRFVDAVGNPGGENVTWSITSGGVQVAVFKGKWRFSNKANEGSLLVSAFESREFGSSFSIDDGAWGAASTSVLDAGIEPSFIPQDFWGHGNFNQKFDQNCNDTKCCDSYFTGSSAAPANLRASGSLRNEMWIFGRCAVCTCPGGGEQCYKTSSPPPGSPILAETCAVTSQVGEFSLTSGGGVALALPFDVAEGNDGVFSFQLTNPMEAREPAVVGIKLYLGEGNLIEETLVSDDGLGAPLLVVEPAIMEATIQQTFPFPGGRNILNISITSNAPLIENTVITVSGLLPPMTLFAVTSGIKCKGHSDSATSLTYGPVPVSVVDGAGHVSTANAGRRHSHWRQDVYAGGAMRFRIVWSFTTAATLSERLARASTGDGVAVEWTVLPAAGGEIVKAGMWKANAGSTILNRFSTSVAWGAIDGVLDGIGTNALSGKFWGQADFSLQPQQCDGYWEDGEFTEAPDVSSRIYMEDAPIVRTGTGGVMSVAPSSDTPGSMILTSLTTLDPSVPHIITVDVVNPMEAWTPVTPALRIESCVNLTAASLSTDAQGIPSGIPFGSPGDKLPLKVHPAAIFDAKMGQSNPFPANKNSLTVTITASFVLRESIGATVVISNLTGASAPSGIMQVTGQHADHFGNSPSDADGREGVWNDTAKTLTLYVVKTLEAGEAYSATFEIENPPGKQDAAVVIVKMSAGVSASARCVGDATTDLSVGSGGLSGRITGAVPGDAMPLKVRQSFWTLGTRISQSTPYPGSVNTIFVAFGTSVRLPWEASAYSSLRVVISGLQGATAPDGPMTIYGWETTDFSPAFAAVAGGQARQGMWSEANRSLTVHLLDDMAASTNMALAFKVTNPINGQASPNVMIATEGVLTTSASLGGLCSLPLSACPIPKPEVDVLVHPLHVVAPSLSMALMGQSTPYPAAVNTLTLTLLPNVFLPAESYAVPQGTTVTITGLAGASAPTGSLHVTGLSLGHGHFDNVTKVVTMRLIGDMEANEMSVTRFNITNPTIYQDSPEMQFSMSGITIAPMSLSKDLAGTPYGIPSSQAGDAAPLKVWEFGFLTKRIGQSSPYPGGQNTISVTFSMTTDVRRTTEFYGSWSVVISGLFGGPAMPEVGSKANGTSPGWTIEAGDCTGGGARNPVNVSATPQLGADVGVGGELGNTALYYGGGNPLLIRDIWIPSAKVWRRPIEHKPDSSTSTPGTAGYQKMVTIFPTGDLKRGEEVCLSFTFTNRAEPQESPDVAIEATGIPLAPSLMDKDSSGILPIFRAVPGLAEPFKVLPISFPSAIMSQSSPYPADQNLLTVTLTPLVDLQPLSAVCINRGGTALPQSIYGTSTSQFLCLADPSYRECDDFCVCIVGACYQEALNQTVIVISNLENVLTPSGSLSLGDPTGMGSESFFSDGPIGLGVQGRGMWNKEREELRLWVSSVAEAGRNYTLQFNVTNPVAFQPSPPIAVSTQGTISPPAIVDKDLDSVLDIPGSRPGDAAPLKIFSVNFTEATIVQSSPFPFAPNMINVTMSSQLPLSKQTALTIFPLTGATLDTGVDPGYLSAGSTISLIGPSAGLFATQKCPDDVESFEDCPGRGRAVWRPSAMSVVVWVTQIIDAGQMFEFAFSVRNPGREQAATGMLVEVGILGERNQAYGFYMPPGNLAPVTVIGATFTTKMIGQSSPYPDKLNTLTLTMTCNVPIPAFANAGITLTGLSGALSPDTPSQSQFEPLPLGGPGAFNFSSALGNGGLEGHGSWSEGGKSFSMWAPNGIMMGVDYVVSFVLRNPATSQAAAAVSIDLGGAVPISRRLMDKDLATDLSIPPSDAAETCERGILGAIPGDAAPLLVYPNSFVCPVAGQTCAGYIGHTTFDPGALNTFTVTLATTTPLTRALDAAIVISNLKNAKEPPAADAGVVSAAIPNENENANCSSLISGLKLGRTPDGPEGTFSWDAEAYRATFYVMEDSLPGQRYTFSFSLTNPLAPQASPLVMIETTGIVLSSKSLSKDPENPPLAITGGFFPAGYPKIGQDSPLPSSQNLIRVTFQATVPMFPGTGTKLTMSGFLGASSDSQVIATEEGGGETFSSEPDGTPGTLRWDAESKTVTGYVVAPMLGSTDYIFGFILMNPPSLQESPPILAQVLGGLETPRITMFPDLSGLNGVRAPLKVLAMMLVRRDIGQSTPYPGALNTITTTLQFNLDVETRGLIITIEGLKNSVTPSGTLNLTCDTGCCDRDDVREICGTGPRVRQACPDSVITTCAAGYFAGGQGEWNQQAGSMTLSLVSKMYSADPERLDEPTPVFYSISFTLRNPIFAQAARSVTISATGTEIAPVPADPDPDYPPLFVTSPQILFMAGGQTSPYPCALNTITVTIAVNVDMVPGVGVTISGFAGATVDSCSSSSAPCPIPLVALPSSPGSSSNHSSSSSNSSSSSSSSGGGGPASGGGGREGRYGTSALWVQESESLKVTAAVVSAAGTSATISFNVRNPRVSQASPNVEVLVSSFVFSSVTINLPRTPIQPDTETLLSTYEAMPGHAAPLFVLPARFTVRDVAQTTNFPSIMNILTVTFATNVPLLEECGCALTIAGLRGVTSDLGAHTLPGLEPTRWRSDQCPTSDRHYFSLSGAGSAIFAATPTPPSDFWLSRGVTRATSSTRLGQVSACPEGGLVTCGGEAAMCVMSEDGDGGGVDDWAAREALMVWFRGQRDPLTQIYERTQYLGALGDGTCDEAFNCIDWAYDDGDCAIDGDVPAEDETLARGLWVPSEETEAAGGGYVYSEGSLVMYLRNDTSPGEPYVLSFAIQNPSRRNREPLPELEMSGIPIARQVVERRDSSYLECDTGGLQPSEDANPLQVYSASFVDKLIGQSDWNPAAKNTITVTLSLSVRLTSRMDLTITIAGLSEASALTGPIDLLEAADFAGQGLPNYFASSPGGAAGQAMWDNTYKQLKLYVVDELLPGKKYAFSFKVNNPQRGQASPTILIGIGVEECFPWAEPMAVKAPLRVTDIVTDSLLVDTRYTLTSITDGTLLDQCRMPQTLPAQPFASGNETYLPDGPWFLEYRHPGYYPAQTLEVKSATVYGSRGEVSSQLWEGTACGAVDQRNVYQTCSWWPRPSGFLSFLVPMEPGVARAVLTWGDEPMDLDIWVVFKRTCYEEGCFSTRGGCTGPSGESLQFISGGGLHSGCPSMIVPPTLQSDIDLGITKLSEVSIDRQARGGRGPEVARFWMAPEGEYHIYVQVVNPPEDSGSSKVFVGAEQVSIYLPDGTQQTVWTSTKSIAAGFWWHVGYFLQAPRDGARRFSTGRRDDDFDASSLTWTSLNFYHLTTDPITYVASFRVSIIISVVDVLTQIAIPEVKYELRESATGQLTSSGIVSDAPIVVKDSSYIVTFKKAGYLDTSATVGRPEGSLEDTIKVDVAMTRQDGSFTLRWSGGQGYNLHLIPCKGTGSWAGNSPDCGKAFGGPCTWAENGLGGVANVSSIPSLGTQVVSLRGIKDGFYDIYVSQPEGEDGPFATEGKLETVLAEYVLANVSGVMKYVVSGRALTQSSTARAGRWPQRWWHAGYLRLQRGGTDAAGIMLQSRFTSSPINGGCRIPTGEPLVKTFDRTVENAMTLSSGLSLLIPAGVWPEGVDPTVTISQLVMPSSPPAGAAEAGPTVFFEPSGITFNPPGVTMSLVVNSGVRLRVGEQLQVMRHSGGASWTPLESTDQGVPENPSSPRLVKAVSMSFSAYTPFVVVPNLVDPGPITSTPYPEIVYSTPAPPAALPLGAIIGGSVGGFFFLLALAACWVFRRLLLAQGKGKGDELALKAVFDAPEDLGVVKKVEASGLGKQLALAERKSRAKYTKFMEEEEEAAAEETALVLGPLHPTPGGKGKRASIEDGRGHEEEDSDLGEEDDQMEEEEEEEEEMEEGREPDIPPPPPPPIELLKEQEEGERYMKQQRARSKRQLPFASRVRSGVLVSMRGDEDLVLDMYERPTKIEVDQDVALVASLTAGPPGTDSMVSAEGQRATSNGSHRNPRQTSSQVFRGSQRKRIEVQKGPRASASQNGDEVEV